eukprot:m.426542 g.426542  ORF g.426542 m.426542 type:complete len:280 (-) comp59069_c0_seq1:118-957(-)
MTTCVRDNFASLAVLGGTNTVSGTPGCGGPAIGAIVALQNAIRFKPPFSTLSFGAGTDPVYQMLVCQGIDVQGQTMSQIWVTAESCNEVAATLNRAVSGGTAVYGCNPDFTGAPYTQYLQNGTDLTIVPLTMSPLESCGPQSSRLTSFVTPCDTTTQYSLDGLASLDPFRFPCENYTACTAGEYQSSPPTYIRNRVCNATSTACLRPNITYLSARPTPTSNWVCSNVTSSSNGEVPSAGGVNQKLSAGDDAGIVVGVLVVVLVGCIVTMFAYGRRGIES